MNLNKVLAWIFIFCVFIWLPAANKSFVADWLADKGYFICVQQMKKILKLKKYNKEIILKILMLAVPMSVKVKISKQKQFLSPL